MTCKEMMTKDPACCVAEDNVVRIAKIMKIQDVGSVPICDSQETRKLVGIVTDRDLALQVVAEQRDPSATKAREVMTRNPVTCLPEDDIEKVMDAMQAHQVRRVPVVDHSSRLVGIIAQADIATRIRRPEKTAEVVEEVSRPSTMRAA